MRGIVRVSFFAEAVNQCKCIPQRDEIPTASNSGRYLAPSAGPQGTGPACPLSLLPSAGLHSASSFHEFSEKTDLV